MSFFSFKERNNGFTRDMLKAAALYLEENYVPYFGSSLKELAMYYLKTDSLTVLLLTEGKVPADEASLRRLEEGITRLGNGEPVQYITGTAPFFGYDFHVDSRVLIPRFDTEVLVETALGFIKEGDRVLDLCSGSGCIGIAAAAETNILLTAADISAGAGEVFSQNVRSLLTTPFYTSNPPLFIRADVFSAHETAAALRSGYDFILSNPPYITSAEMDTLTPDVLSEPRQALFGGKDGLEFYRRITPLSNHLLKDGGALFFECGRGQSESVVNIMKENGYPAPVTVKDANGIDRVVYGKLRKAER